MNVKMAITNVCRLCLTTDELVWVFDKRFENSENMKDVIHVTTGVEITAKDIMSQNVCKKCCQVTIKMFEFRRTSMKNDQYLKDQCKMFLKEKEIKIPNTDVTIRSEGKKDLNIAINSETKAIEVKQDPKPVYKIHPSVRELFKVYPQIKLPTVCLKYDITPCVSMTMDQVEQYFKSRNLDFQKYTKLALKAGRVATKKTAPHAKAKSSIHPKTSKVSKQERKDKPPRSDDAKEIDAVKIKVNGDINSKDKTNAHIKASSKSSVKNHVVTSKITPAEGEPSSHKRKSIDETEEKKEFKKTNFVESLGLTPKIDPPSSVLSYIANKSMQVHICEICNSVQYSSKDLRRHQNKHLRCQFCKMKLRSLDMKKEHLDGRCTIKNMMNQVPDVVLERIELDKSVRARYPEAFEGFSPREDRVNENSSPTAEKRVNSTSDLNNFKGFDNKTNVKVEPQKPVTPTKDFSEVIEILSDDEEPSTMPSTSAKSVSSAPPSEPNPQTVSAPQQDSAGNTPAQPPQQDNVVYNTVSIVRPDIKIKGNCALDIIDARLTDIKVLKELLTNYRPVHIYLDKRVQTYLPNNESIFVNNMERSAELKLLKPQLYVYKIPVVMKNGAFGVRYSYSPQSNPPKKLCLWNDLKAVDIKPPKVLPWRPASTEAVNRTILPSTATYNSSGVFSRPPQPSTSKFIRVNTSSLSPITTAAFSSPPLNLINTNPLLNNFLQNSMATSAPQQPVVVPAVNAETTASGAAQQFGTIRVKNVWELK